MIIKLNNKDIHGAIRGLLQDQNIIDSYTEIDTTITVGRGKNAGVSAEVTILDKSTDSAITKEDTIPPANTLFDNDEVDETT